jgi:glycosyltransferase A (GT-A) superfamily protein (DUF2064 family)
MARGTAPRTRRARFAHRLIIMAKSPRRGYVKRRLAREIGEGAASSLPVLRGVSRLPQGRGDLGRRMQRLFDRLPPGPVIIIGSDIPAIAPERIAEAFALLGRHDAVLGRALDGGFWLIGLKRSPRVLASFAHVRWSGPHALGDTLANLTGARVAFTATLCDVDTREDYLSLCASAARLVSGRARFPH